MAIADIAKREKTELPWRTCAVCHALDTIPTAEADGLRALLADPTWRYDQLEEALRNDPDTPLDIDRQALSRHARGKCSAREKLR